MPFPWFSNKLLLFAGAPYWKSGSKHIRRRTRKESHKMNRPKIESIFMAIYLPNSDRFTAYFHIRFAVSVREGEPTLSSSMPNKSTKTERIYSAKHFHLMIRWLLMCCFFHFLCRFRCGQQIFGFLFFRHFYEKERGWMNRCGIHWNRCVFDWQQTLLHEILYFGNKKAVKIGKTEKFHGKGERES